jgi:hypothetical protein
MTDKDDHDSAAASPDAVTRAKGLARLLIYALLDATDLGSGRTAKSVRAAIEQLKAEYGLKDHEILQHR